MEIKLSVTEFLDVCKSIQRKPERIFRMIRTEVRETVSRYLNEMMKVELTEFLGRKPYERGAGGSNHRNGSYPRSFTMKGVGEVGLNVPRDRE